MVMSMQLMTAMSASIAFLHQLLSFLSKQIPLVFLFSTISSAVPLLQRPSQLFLPPTDYFSFDLFIYLIGSLVPASVELLLVLQ